MTAEPRLADAESGTSGDAVAAPPANGRQAEAERLLPFSTDTANLGLAGLPYASRRIPTVATRGVVATSQPLAAQAGLRMLLQGGNAVDAAVATAIALTVVEPNVNGIGGDAFALIWDGAALHGLNGSGRAPAKHTLDHFHGRGVRALPARGWDTVTVPGAPAAWRDLHGRFGSLPFEALFQPAIEYAERGYAVTPLTAAAWVVAHRLYRAENHGPEFRPWFETFTPGDRAPQPVDI